MSREGDDFTHARVRYLSPDHGAYNRPLVTVWEAEDNAGFRFRYDDGTEFRVNRNGTEISASWPEPLTVEDAATYLLGPIFGFVLRLRGIVSLHASAFAVDGRAVALLGDAGAGKSTTVAAMAMRGLPVLTDDVAALEGPGDRPMVRSGYPGVRLWPESVQNLFGAPDRLPVLTPNWDKRSLDLKRPGYMFQEQPLPLAAIYVLADRSDGLNALHIEPVRPRDALLTLVANTYVNYLLDRDMRAHEFSYLARLVRSVPVRRVTPHKDPNRIQELCDLILDDFAQLAPGAPTGIVN